MATAFFKEKVLNPIRTMPIFEYYCSQTNRIYSFYARRPGMGAQVPRCPDGGDLAMQRVVSSFTAPKGVPEPGAELDEDDPRAEQLMAEMEREIAGIDEQNPDPRQLAQLMRKVSDATGEKMPESMREMVSRLEAGEDPEALEAEMGDLDAIDDDAEAAEAKSARSVRQWLRRQVAERDPNLYELSDYL